MFKEGEKWSADYIITAFVAEASNPMNFPSW
jgi:hypothetical protein